MMRWFGDIKNILTGEPETWLNYLHGQQLHNRPHFTRERPLYAGLALQVAKFGATLIRDFRLKKQHELNRPTKFFVFAGTTNQMRSLDKTIAELVNKGEQTLTIGSPRLLTTEDYAKGYIPFQLTLLDIVQALVLFAIRGRGLYRVLKAKHPVSVDWHFSTFCSVYIYLAYFYRVLSRANPAFVITANDHNAANRCMLAVAHYLDIKTVYLQHASVSNIFPALRLNFAFLDGQCALDTYRLCEPNQPVTPRKAPVPEVILSGQKKHVKRSENRQTNAIGVALNALDNPKAGVDFISALAARGADVCLRWHPGQAKRDIQQYRTEFADSKRVTLSDPEHESISNFMENIGWLIAGNSSIHLEAALAGVMPIYYELSPPDQPDYYGYAKHGLTKPAASIDEVLRFVTETQGSQSTNADAVRYYSSTYLTEWDGREGELVAECLQKLASGERLPVRITAFFGSESFPNNRCMADDVY